MIGGREPSPGEDSAPASLGLAMQSFVSESAKYPGHLLGVELVVERHGGETGAPDAVEQREIFRAVLHRQRNAVAGVQAVTGDQRAGDALYLGFEGGIAELAAFPRDGRLIGVDPGDGLKGEREVHGATLPPGILGCKHATTVDAQGRSSFPPSAAQSGNPEARAALAAGSPIASPAGSASGMTGGVQALQSSFPPSGATSRNPGLRTRRRHAAWVPDTALMRGSGMTSVVRFTMRAASVRGTYPRSLALWHHAASVACDGTWMRPFTVLTWQRPAPGRRAEWLEIQEARWRPLPAKRQQWRGCRRPPSAAQGAIATSGNGREREAKALPRDTNRRTRVPQGNPGTVRSQGARTGLSGRLARVSRAG